MRFLSALMNDMRYQRKYGFYWLYAFFSAVYCAVILLCPREYKETAATLIILSDPAMLGSFFIGGIWLLEQGEGLHGFWGISPLRPVEYVLSKGLSMGLLSTVSAAVIAGAGLGGRRHYFLMSASVLAGSMVFTFIGLVLATYARSVNHYMLLAAPLEVLIVLPPMLGLFGLGHPALDLLPGMALYRMIGAALGSADRVPAWAYGALLLWLAAALLAATMRIEKAMRLEGGGKA